MRLLYKQHQFLQGWASTGASTGIARNFMLTKRLILVAKVALQILKLVENEIVDSLCIIIRHLQVLVNTDHTHQHDQGP